MRQTSLEKYYPDKSLQHFSKKYYDLHIKILHCGNIANLSTEYLEKFKMQSLCKCIFLKGLILPV